MSVPPHPTVFPSHRPQESLVPRPETLLGPVKLLNSCFLHTTRLNFSFLLWTSLYPSLAGPLGEENHIATLLACSPSSSWPSTGYLVIVRKISTNIPARHKGQPSDPRITGFKLCRYRPGVDPYSFLRRLLFFRASLHSPIFLPLPPRLFKDDSRIRTGRAGNKSPQTYIPISSFSPYASSHESIVFSFHHISLLIYSTPLAFRFQQVANHQALREVRAHLHCQPVHLRRLINGSLSRPPERFACFNPSSACQCDSQTSIQSTGLIIISAWVR